MNITNSAVFGHWLLYPNTKKEQLQKSWGTVADQTNRLQVINKKQYTLAYEGKHYEGATHTLFVNENEKNQLEPFSDFVINKLNTMLKNPTIINNNFFDLLVAGLKSETP